MKKYIQIIKNQIWFIIKAPMYMNKQKIFCVGRNKTGTTSLYSYFKSVGIAVGDQRRFELQVKNISNGNYFPLFNLIKFGGIAFQDVPFSWHGTFKLLDKKFPNSKFILTIRDNENIWYDSLIRYQKKIMKTQSLPTKKDIQNFEYVYKGWAWDCFNNLYDVDENDLYNKDKLTNSYLSHNMDVISHFKDKPDQLLVLNLKDKDAKFKLSKFLGLKTVKEIPKENIT